MHKWMIKFFIGIVSGTVAVCLTVPTGILAAAFQATHDKLQDFHTFLGNAFSWPWVEGWRKDLDKASVGAQKRFLEKIE